jgi:hypothetical protein
MIATLMGVPDPPLRGATAGCGSGALTGAAAAGVLVLAAAGVDVLDELLLPPLELPQPAATNAKATMVSASQIAPRPGPLTECIVISSSNDYLVNRQVWARPTPSLA